MNSNKESFNEDKFNKSIVDDEIELKEVFSFFYRNKKPLALYGLAGILIGGIFAFTSKKVWDGEFQIVLQLNDQSTNLQKPSLNLGFGLGRKFDPLATEVGILKSPSVLMDVFKFVKEDRVSKKKGLNDKFNIQKLKFKDWKNKNLKVGLQKNTSILNLSYQDNDKEIILPVLNKISKAYQEYSGEKRSRNLELSSNYFRDQVELYKEKSKNSLREAQQFASKYDLSLLTNEGNDIDIPNSINIENIRVKAANKIRLINAQLAQLKNLKPNTDAINYIGANIPALNDLFSKFKEIDTKISSLKVLYKDSDKIIQDQLRSRDIIVKVIFKQAKLYLEAQKASAEAELESTNRPDGVIVEYRQLLSSASKDRATLNKLEIQYRNVLLEKARTKDPWELITTPTLYPDPIAPLKKRIVALGLLGGLFLGSIATLFEEKRKNIVYSTKDIEKITGLSKIDELTISKPNILQESLKIFLSSKFVKEINSLVFIQVGEYDNQTSSKLSKLVSKSLEDKKHLITKNIKEVENYNKVILIVFMGSIKKDELVDLNKNMNFLQKDTIGYIAIKR